MGGTSQNQNKSFFRRSREEREARSAQHPVRSALPFLGIAGVVLSGAVFFSSCTLCYAIHVQGQSVSCFQGEETYLQAISQAEARTSRILETDYSFPEEVTVRTTLAPKSHIETPDQVTDSLMNIIPELEHVYTLWVDGTMVGAVRSDDDINRALSIVKAQYETPETLTITVESKVNLRYEYVSADVTVLTAQELADLLLEQSPQTFPYTVQEGDTIEALLERFDLTQARLQALNPEVDLTAQVTAMGIELPGGEDEADLAALWAAEFGTPLEAGLELTVEQTCPRLVVSTVEEQSLARAVPPDLEVQPDSTMFTGEQRILQEGVAGEQAVLTRTVKRCGVTVATTDLSAVTTTEATPLVVATGTQPKPQLPDGCLFLWPVRGPITSDYGYRFIFGETNYHRGVDIAASAGTAINAAADGVVTFSGEKGTYGNLVVVSHQNGFQTYYAHCSKLLVNVGDTVTQGQPIAAVGSTGRSTGPHCHFEVRYQNSPIDPLLYLPGENNAPARTEIPVDEEEPTTPETPTEPAVPETPVLPEEPAQPETPAVPEEPVQPEQPAEEPQDPALSTGPDVTAQAALPPEPEKADPEA